jgi:GTPase SAR1 family protein
MAILEYRPEHVSRLREMRDKLSQINAGLSALPDIETEDAALNKDTLGADITTLSERIDQRLSRVDSPTCRIAVIGLEKQGKSSFVNAWIGKQALPSDTKRCTWASSTIVNGMEYKARVSFSSRVKFEHTIDGLFKALNSSREKIGFPLPPNVGDIAEIKPIMGNPAFKDLEQLSRFWNEIHANLERPPLDIRANTIEELYDDLFQYISLRAKKDGAEQGIAYAVDRADIYFPMAQENLEFAIDDLPGIDAPGNRAEEMTWDSVKNHADVIVLVKSAFNNASLNSNEENIWDTAKRSDSSLALTDRLFVILNQADADKVEHGRDCHVQAFQNFSEKGVQNGRIFYCSSRAELFDAMGKDGLSFPYTQEEYDKAVQKICGYRGQAETTTGFPEFKKALYHFLETDFPALERKALQDLISQYDDATQKVRKLLAAFSDASASEQNAPYRERERFETLWDPRTAQEKNIAGLRNAIFKTVNALIREVTIKPEVSAAFLDGIRTNITESKAHFLETITLEAFNSTDLSDQGTSLQRFSDMRNKYFEKVQDALKRAVYHGLALDISRNITGHLQSIWEKAINATTTEAERGIAVVGAEAISDFLKKHPNSKSNVVFGQLFAENAETHTQIAGYGFAALLKSIVHASAEYLLNSETNSKYDGVHTYDDARVRVLQKATLYQQGVCDNAINSEIGRLRVQHKDDEKSLLEAISNNDSLFRKLVGFFTPKPFDTLASMALNFVGKLKRSEQGKVQETQKKENPFAKLNNSDVSWNNSDNAAKSKEPAQTAEEVVEDLKTRVEIFYYILEAMLFDDDFGFIGYYRAFLEEFRSSGIAAEMDKEGGMIKALAFKFREQIWSNEAEFKTNAARQALEQRIAGLKQALGQG